MEVCGTHTQSFFRFGLDKLIPETVRLIAGPGCPVCVSSQDYIDKAIAYSKLKNTIIATFGDMLRVPGSSSSLEKEKANGAHVRIVYSCLDSIRIAKANPSKKVIFLAVGFETTIPTIALTILRAQKEGIKNLSFFTALKTMPYAMEYLLKDPKLNISGFLCPGHVSAIIGVKSYQVIAKKHRIACCVCGFEPLDIIEGVYILLKQIVNHRPEVANEYLRVVTKDGNIKAQRIISRVFKNSDASWRGLGIIPHSGLKIKASFKDFDSEVIYPLKLRIKKQEAKQRLCRCGEVLKGIITPQECPLFKKVCTPYNPYGPCMVSPEGSCNSYYKYHLANT
jgi:hydrogenase expression/formation protein HypD